MSKRLLPLLLPALLIACEVGSDGAQPANQAETASPAAAAPSPAAAPAAETQASTPMQPSPDADACGAERLGRWLNALPTATVRAEIREAAGHDRIRYIAPGDAVTLDHRPDRLNVETGEDGRIKLFRCG